VTDTIEGIETNLTLQFYSHQHFIISLLPLFELITSPLIIPILDAGFEWPISVNDLECRQHYNFIRASQSVLQ
jgi:hypothetical protein